MPRACFPLALLMILSSCAVFAQTVSVNASIKDFDTKEPLAFCNVVIKGSNKGTITNYDGIFNIELKSLEELLEISFLGYQTISIKAKYLVKTNTIFLKKTDYMLPEITINAKDDFLYDLINTCRKKTSKNKNYIVSKAYYGIESKVENTSVEFLECYFNGNLQGHNIISLLLKNGRLAKSIYNSTLYSNHETSKAIRLLKLDYDNGYYPAFPLQMSKNDMQKSFYLNIIPSDSSMFHISFKPKADEQSLFKGELWIDKKTMLPLKINLSINNAEILPIITTVEDSLKNVSMDITLNYKLIDGNIFPELISFDFKYTIIRGLGAQLLDPSLDKQLTYNSHAVLYFYDYDNPFILPFFEYDAEIYDYQKLQLIPYNHNFWDYNEALLLSESQKKTIGLLVKDSLQFYYREGNYGRDFGLKERGVILAEGNVGFSAIFTFWFPDRRVMIHKSYPKNKTVSLQAAINYSASMLVKLKTQILLDVNKVYDSLVCDTYSVFEEIYSYYKMPVKEYTNPMVNIYFDLCEIKRRELQSILDTSNLSLEDISKLYYKIEEEKEVLSYKFLYETDYGANQDKMEEWNKYVIDNLGIDNLALFNDYYKKREMYKDSLENLGLPVPFNYFE
ncbi:MAG: carboxypeptidase-like regulatory domain-containing protein [Bacteroidales bacterium]|nr:carboxypeptidase-like regulatory domain-containing protein [Bacteroidales bacterium]